MKKQELEEKISQKHDALQKACRKLNESGKCPPLKNAFCPTCLANNTLRYYCWMQWADLRNDERLMALANKSHVITTHNLPMITKDGDK